MTSQWPAFSWFITRLNSCTYQSCSGGRAPLGMPSSLATCEIRKSMNGNSLRFREGVMDGAWPAYSSLLMVSSL
jgi:hypothetical protein